ncbi:MAG: hypothetical protein QW757_03875 [Candidatus Woesearchaeota archaeon]
MNKKKEQKNFEINFENQNNLEKEYILEFLMKSNSLKDLLEILSNICKNLDLNYLNPKLKHFKYFQFTFFGLMAKAKTLIELMIYRADFLKNKLPDFNYDELIKIKETINKAFALIKKNKMIEGKNMIIELNKEYILLFNEIIKKNF